MPSTKRGIYHNLKESKYTVSNAEIVLFFSSELYLNKFIDGYEQNREVYRNKFKKNDRLNLNFDTLYDILLYDNIEKRGFRATLNGRNIEKETLEMYSLRKMQHKESPIWKRINRRTPKERLKRLWFDEIGEVNE